MTSPDSHRTMLGDRGRSDVRRFLSPTEATVAGIWSELLEQGDIGPEDDFFELGGDSLLAVWLMEEIAERTGRHLPLSLLLEGATIRHLASALDAQGAQPGMWRGINVHGTRCPLFWIHGWAELLSMRNYFDADQPVFQIQDPLARRWQVKPRLELSARRYVEELRRIQRDRSLPADRLFVRRGDRLRDGAATSCIRGSVSAFSDYSTRRHRDTCSRCPRDSGCIRRTPPSSGGCSPRCGRDLGLAEALTSGTRSRRSPGTGGSGCFSRSFPTIGGCRRRRDQLPAFITIPTATPGTLCCSGPLKVGRN